MSAQIKSKSRPLPARGTRSEGEDPSLLGQRLMARGLLNEEDLQKTLARQQALPADQQVRRLGSLLIDAGLVSLRHVSEALGEQRGVQAQASAPGRLDPNLRTMFPKDLLLELGAVPLCIVSKTVAVAMADPHDQEHIALLQGHTSYTIKPMQAPQTQIYHLLGTIKAGEGPPVDAPRRPTGLPSRASEPPARGGQNGSARQSSPSIPRLPRLSAASGSRSTGTPRSPVDLLRDSTLSQKNLAVSSSPGRSQPGQPSGHSGRPSLPPSGGSGGNSSSSRPSLASNASSRSMGAVGASSGSARGPASSASGTAAASSASMGSAASSRSSKSGTAKSASSAARLMVSKGFMDEVAEYTPWIIAFLLVAAIAGGGYFLVAMRADAIKEEADRPVVPKPKPPAAPVPKPAAPSEGAEPAAEAPAEAPPSEENQ